MPQVIHAPNVSSTSNTCTMSCDANDNHISFEAFYDKYAAALYGHIKKTLHKDDVSQQVMIEAFNKIYCSLDKITSSKENVFISALKLVRAEISKKKVDMVMNQILYKDLEARQ